jgi:hypothetical protein
MPSIGFTAMLTQDADAARKHRLRELKARIAI